MDYALRLILKQINQKFVCCVDSKEHYYENGDKAIGELEKDRKHYSLASISAKDSVVVIDIKDITEEIRTHNEEFIAEHKKQFGYEPSMFDGM